MTKFWVYTVILIATTGPCANAQLLEDWINVLVQPRGTELLVWYKNGGFLVEGLLKSSSHDGITLVLSSGKDFGISKLDVREIRSRSHDGKRNGTLIGLGVGIGLAGVAAARAPEKGFFHLSKGRTFALSALAYGGVGALMGYIADGKHRQTELVYRAQ